MTTSRLLVVRAGSPTPVTTLDLGASEVGRLMGSRGLARRCERGGGGLSDR